MAKNSSSSAGGIIGLVLGFIVVAGIAGTPFYLGMLQSPAQAVDEAAATHVEVIRRAVLAADAHLAALADMQDSLSESQKLDTEEISSLLTEYPDLMESAMKELNQTAQMLRASESADTKRGVEIKGVGSIQSGKPNVQQAYSQLQGKYLKSASNVMRQADAALKELKSLRVGQFCGDARLEGARIQAIMRLSEGRMKRIRAEYAQGQAGLYRTAARRCAEEISVLNAKAEAIETQKPSQVLSDLQAKISEQEAQTEDFADQIASLQSEIGDREARLEELESTAASAHEAMDALNPRTMNPADYQRQYEALAKQARTAESEAAALVNGTLLDVDEETGAGTPVIGLRDLRIRLDHAQKLHEQSESIARMLDERRDELTQLAADLTDRQEGLRSEVRDRSGDMRDLLEAADGHDVEAAKATKDAVNILKNADAVCKQATTAARNIKQEASGTPGAQDPYTKFVTSDKNAECATQVLAAEIAYEAALTEYSQIASSLSSSSALAFIARMTGEGDADDVGGVDEALRESAIKHIEAAKTAYKTAGGLMMQTNFKAPSGTQISGKDLAWQLQVANAAAEMLHALIVADQDAEVSLQLKDAAHALLQEASKGREQSPALTPAIDTLFYLRQSVQE